MILSLTFLLAILAGHNTCRTVISHVAFLVAVATLSLELARVGTVGLGLEEAKSVRRQREINEGEDYSHDLLHPVSKLAVAWIED